MAGLARRSGFVDSAGEHLYFECVGAGDPLVLCHGAGGNHAIWWQQVPVFAQRHTVVSWDHRGFGRSTDRARESGPAAAVQDLGAILDHLGIGPAHVVGQSMGGWTALGFALARPSGVRSLVLRARAARGRLTAPPSPRLRHGRRPLARRRGAPEQAQEASHPRV